MPNAENYKIQTLRATRLFTDRLELRKAYHSLIHKCREENCKNYYIINYYGIGGIGKTTLLRQLQAEVHEELESEKPIVVHVDFAIEDIRDQIGALETIVSQIQHQRRKWKYEHYSMALYAYYESIGYWNDREKEEKNFLERHPIVEKTLSLVELVPGGELINLSKTAYQFIYEARKRFITKKKEKRIEMMNQQSCNLLYREVLSAFLTDTNNALKDDDSLLYLFFDTYEAISSMYEGLGKRSELSYWILGPHGLLNNLCNSVIVIAGREKLKPLTVFSCNWEKYIEYHITNFLSESDCENFLVSAGVQPESLRRDIIDLTHGSPLYLDICIDVYESLIGCGTTPSSEDFGNTPQQLIERYLLYISVDEQDVLYLMATLRVWSMDLLMYVANHVGIIIQPSVYDKLTNLSYVKQSENNTCTMISEVAEVLKNQIKRHVASKIITGLVSYWDQNRNNGKLICSIIQNVIDKNYANKDVADMFIVQSLECNIYIRYEYLTIAYCMYKTLYGSDSIEIIPISIELAVSLKYVPFDSIGFHPMKLLCDSIKIAKEKLGRDNVQTLWIIDHICNIMFYHLLRIQEAIMTREDYCNIANIPNDQGKWGIPLRDVANYKLHDFSWGSIHYPTTNM